MDDVDFRVSEVGPWRVGRKAMAVNLSDIAAMAAVPTAAVVSVVLPKSCGQDFAQELYRGLRERADEFQVPIVGGDTNSWAGGLVITVTVLGEVTSRGPVLRSGAKVGDTIFVTGPLGGSLAGHHLDFVPRIREALLLHQHCDLHAMIDLSDGLSSDLHHICQASGVGAVLHADALPRRSNSGTIAAALNDGEDFELAFTVGPADAEKLRQHPPLPVWPVGEIVATGYWLDDQGHRQPMQPGGWVHEI
jgi:thiamine-monophosphate kinase